MQLSELNEFLEGLDNIELSTMTKPELPDSPITVIRDGQTSSQWPDGIKSEADIGECNLALHQAIERLAKEGHAGIRTG